MVSLKLVLATRNDGKISELGEALAKVGIEVVPVTEIAPGEGPEETGSSYEENALLKAAQAAHASGLPALADDSGLEVDALNGSPGIYSARFGGQLSDGERIAHLLQKIRHVPADKRGARFVSVLVLASPEGKVQSFHGSCGGRILLGPRGEGGHGYDPIFWSPELQKTFAEATSEEKGRVSHRGQALRSLLDWVAGEDSWLSAGQLDGGA